MKRLILFSLLLAGIIFGIQNVTAAVIYESLPDTNSDIKSLHGVGGPVLADDFTPSSSGWVQSIEWWGSSSFSDLFEITFHPDSGLSPPGPDTGATTAKLSQHFVTATGVDSDGDGIFYYSAAWNPQDVFLTGGIHYWFSVANAADNWTWANGLAPSIGSEQYDAVRSTGIGPDGGPHFGPWTGISSQDFAFRINVPEPATLALISIGLAGIGYRRYKAA
jgi:hypothetical protein